VKAKKCATILLLLLMFIPSATIVNKAASQYAEPNVLFIDPPSIVNATLTKGFQVTIGINVSYVEGLHSWQIKIRYNPALLYTNYTALPSQVSLIKEGPFLKTSGLSTTFHTYLEADYAFIACSITGTDLWGVEGGSAELGYLATITFIVLTGGETRLEILSDPSDARRTKLSDVNLNTIPYTSQDGYFRNVVSGIPSASFFPLPTFPLWGDEVTFNASASSGLDGIARYLWFFGDINFTTKKENTANETDPITSHQYTYTGTAEKNFTVRLSVIDNMGTTGNLSVRVLTVVSSRLQQDLAIVSISVNSTYVEPGGSLAITVYVENQGNSSATSNVTAYYDSTPIDTKTDITLNVSESRPIKFNWNTTGVPQPQAYNISAWVWPLKNETDTSDNTYTYGARVAVTFAPHVSFTYEPASPYIDEVIVFNASASQDPDGTITRYFWLWDQSTFDATNPISEHSYPTGGTHYVALTVTDNLGASNSTSQWINVSKLPTVVTLTMSPIATVGLNTTINGSISPTPTTANVAIFYRSLGEDIWNCLGNTTTNIHGQFSLAWLPSEPGTFEFKANWTGDQKYNGDESDVIRAVAKLSSTISLFVNPSSVTLGEEVSIAGSISPHPSSEASVTIIYRIGEGTWNSIGNATTDQNGNYIYSWKPPAVGVYEIRALWDGDDITHGAESNLARVQVVGASSYLTYIVIAAMVAVAAVAIALFLRFKKKVEQC